MALIPPDLGVQLRAQNEALLNPVSPVRPIPADLPELQIGQSFTARIQEVLPENTYKAMVAGKSLTLQLPEGAKPGDLMELVVIDRTAKVVIAQLAPKALVEGAQEAYPFTRLSNAGQMIGKLLVPEGETPTPAPLNRGEPLLSRPPATAQDLLPALKSAVTQSGLFYESHQAQWVTGKLPLANLLHEPQGRLSAPDLLIAHRIAEAVDAWECDLYEYDLRSHTLTGTAFWSREPGNADLEAYGRPLFAETSFDGVGFGLGFAVLLDAAANKVLRSEGEYFWGGAASTAFWVDPREEIVALFLTQLLPSSTYPIRSQLNQLVQQALVD